ncbi:MAG: NADH-quinone oxidoreductase subunit NuoG [Anaerolineales bacterium]|nr:NADH-quinone oxidoreductase subunit NuoG [Anaerolineales bacterium]
MADITLTIDGVEVSVPEGTLIVDAAKKAGVDVPVFCYHPKMDPVGMCRMCLVDVGRPVRDRETGELELEEDGAPKIQFGPKLETACTLEVSEGMVVQGETDNVTRARKDVIEFLLTSHPLDCPICDKGGECPLQDLTMDHGPGKSRFILDEKIRLAKHYPLGDLIYLDRERCIQCARCTRFQSEVVDDPVIGFDQRGRKLQIVTFSEPGFDSYFSGNTTDICPVGALTTVDFRFGARPWELTAAASVCTHCPVGCNLTLNVRREANSGGDIVVKRVMPRQNEWVNELWICDKGRFAYHFSESEERLSQPLLRKDGELQPVGWGEAIAAAAAGLRAAGEGTVALGSGRLSNEDLFNLNGLARGLGGSAYQYTDMAGGDLVAQIGLGQDSNFADMGAGTAILVVASDLEEEAPVWWLRVKQAAERGAALIVANPRPTKADRHATHLLRYTYGNEAATVLGLVNALSAKRPDLPGGAKKQAGQKEFQDAAQLFAEAENGVVIYGSEGIGLTGSKALAQACANLLITTNHIGRPNNGLLGVWSRANSQGAWDMGLAPSDNLEEALSAAKAVILAGADPAGDDPHLADALEEAEFVVVQELFLTESARQADVVFPVQAFTEREGTFTSGERRVQRYYPAVPPRAGARPDYTVLAQVGAALDLDLEGRAARLVFRRIAENVSDYADLSYRRLAEVVEQWPIIGHEEGKRYYGGTTYENHQGLGVQLRPSVEGGESAALAWIQPEEAGAVPEGRLLAVPVTQLYDRGRTIEPTEFLHTRIRREPLVLHPEDAVRAGLEDGGAAQARFNGYSAQVTIRTDDNHPQGVALAPRSLGLPLTEPTPVMVGPVSAEEPEPMAESAGVDEDVAE